MTGPLDWSTVDDEAIVGAMAGVRVWARGGQRAPHKPLLLLWMLARIQNGLPGRARFTEIHDPLRQALEDFGPPRKSHHPEFPFWHLRSDGLWVIDRGEELERATAGSRRRNNPPKSLLLDLDPEAGFPPALERRLRSDPQLVNRIAHRLLDDHFPPSLHEDILDSIGMPWIQHTAGRRRDPEFRHTILRIYEHRCAVCGWDGRLGSRDLALEAAHVRWHTAGGPDTEDNGLALCSLHHRAFDLGALGLAEDLTLTISQHLHGSRNVEEWLHRFAGRPMRRPQPGCPVPAPEHIRWHQREVFRGPPRNTPSSPNPALR